MRRNSGCQRREDGFAQVGVSSSTAQAHREIPRAAVYVDKMFNGTKPADLPIEQSTSFESVVDGLRQFSRHRRSVNSMDLRLRRSSISHSQPSLGAA